MSVENSELLDRVADLEKRTVEQANELTGLRTSLADCQRRISLLEGNKGTAMCPTRPSVGDRNVPPIGSSRNAPHRSDMGSSRRGASKSRSGHSVTSSRDGPLSTHRGATKSTSFTALERHTVAYPVFSASVDKHQLHYPLVGRSVKAMSMVDGQFAAHDEPPPSWQSTSKYFETADATNGGYSIMCRSAYEGYSAMPHQSLRSSKRKPPPPLPPALPPSSLCLPPNLSRGRVRPTSGPCTTYSHGSISPLLASKFARSPLHPSAWKPGGQAICSPIPRDTSPLFLTSAPRRQPSPVSLYRMEKQESKEASYNATDGVLRVYLHGRASNFYLPTNVMETFDLTSPHPAPEETLKLEWVIAIHPDRITIATGQVAGHSKQYGKPHVRIWSSIDLRTLRILGVGDFDRGLCCLSFSKTDSGARLCAVDDGQDHAISVWEWQKGRKITETKCSNDPVVAAEFHPLDESCIVTCGKNQLNFWTLDGTTLSKKSALFETGKISCDKPKFVLCLAFAENGDLLTGDSSGNILVWRRGTNQIHQICRNIHEGGIFSLCITHDGRLVSGGSKDRNLIFFDVALNPTGEVKELPEMHGSVRTIVQGPGDMLLIGSTRNTILQTGADLEFSSLMFGHTDEFWALAKHPQNHQFLTAGHDRLVVLWDSLSKQAVWAKELNDPIQCAAFYPVESADQSVNGNGTSDAGGDGDLLGGGASQPLIALGSVSGRWLVMDSARHEVIAAHSDGIGEQIQCIAYSPDGQYIALGSRDNSIYIYQVLEQGRKYSRIGRCTGHSSFVSQLDWSTDSHYLRTVSGDYELLFWTAKDCRQVTAPSTLRDLDWATHSCTLGWSVTGIWPEGADGTDVNTCDGYMNSELLATGDDSGKVKLFQFPVSKPKAECHTYGGHSSHVTNVVFLYDGSRLISTGGKDTATLQWEVCL